MQCQEVIYFSVIGSVFQCRQMRVKKCGCEMQKEKEVPCYKEYQCENKCNKMRDCGKHQCKRKVYFHMHSLHFEKMKIFNLLTLLHIYGCLKRK